MFLFNKNSSFFLRSLLYFYFFFNLFFISCNTTEPNGKPVLLLQPEDAGCIEAWLKVETNNVILPAQLNLFLNDTLKQTIELTKTDTVIYDEGLQPNKTYKYKVTIKPNGQIGEEIKSEPVTVKTLDTTSHNFTWKIFTFGGVNGSSILRDVAIINENDIWAVGEIHTAETDQFDSNGVWVQPYNAVHWDGQKWELKRVMFPVDADKPNSYKSAKECRAIFIFNENDFVITASTQFAFMNSKGEYSIKTIGFKWENRFTINAIWGTSSENFYVVGYGGNIAHYNGSSWTNIESGTELSFVDIWGSFNKWKNEYEILVTAIDYNSDDKMLVMINENTARVLSLAGFGNTQTQTIWFEAGRKYYLGGRHIYVKNNLDEPEWKKIEMDNLYIRKIRGQGLNDIVASCTWGELLHYNGASWKSYKNELGTFYGWYSSIKIKDNMVVAVGFENTSAKIIVGKR